MTLANDDLDAREDLRGRVRVLIERFERAGVSTSAPDLLDLDSAALEAVTSARGRLVDLISNDERLRTLDTLGEGELESLLLDLIRLSVEGRLHSYLNEIEVPYPVYNFFAGFDENANGPWDRDVSTPEAKTPVDWKLMGFPVGMPLGVPASGITANSRWIRFFSRRGFNILTYKTVRSRPTPPHRYPHWVFVEDGDPWESQADISPVRGDLSLWPKDLAQFATANSFGVPSPHPDVWRADVRQALRILLPGQLMIVSVMGSGEHFAGSEMVKDFVAVALMAEEAGAPAVEINLSCPNTVKDDVPGMSGPICRDPEVTEEIVVAVRSALKAETKLVAKLSYLEQPLLRDVVARIATHVDAISGINTVQAPISRTDSEQSPFRGTAEDPERLRDAAGVSGTLIKPLGLDFVRNVAMLKAEYAATFDIIGMGGVTTPEDVASYAAAGANAVQTATGACLFPELPLAQIDFGIPWSPASTVVSSSEVRERRMRPKNRVGRVGEALASGGLSLVLGRGDGSR